MTPARLARVICRRRAGIVDAFEVVKVILIHYSTTTMIYRETTTKTGKLKLRYKMETHTIGQNREIITTIYKDT
jgi:hypothetical protein